MRNYRILIIGIFINLIIGIFLSLLCYNVSEGDIVIRQEKIEKNGIMAYQFNPLDLEILDILIKDNIQTLEDYTQWLQENIEYVGDIGDYWQSPEETLERKAGDCEDFAFLNVAFLRVLGYNPRAMGLLYINGEGHAICLFMEGDYYSYFSNMILERTQVETMEELSNYFSTGEIERIYELKWE